LPREMEMSGSVTTGKNLIAICGKGGVGKTALSAMMAKVFLESGDAPGMLLIDADPAMGLCTAMGVAVRRTMGQVREEVIRASGRGNREESALLAARLDYMVLEALHETDRYAVLAMGRTETLGCFCPVNDLLRDGIETLSKDFDTILIDCEAGLEQINRQVVRGLQMLVVVSDASLRGLQTVELIMKMVEDEKVISCERMGLVFNRVQGGEERLMDSARKLGIEVLGCVPQDPFVADHDMTGKPIVDLPENSPALAAVRSIVNQCFPQFATSR
jgi:CO dehydrogenase maturation factor